MNCRELKELMDSYIGDELLVETNHDVLRHLENCRDCRDVLGRLRSLRERIRYTAKNAPFAQIDPAFTVRVTSELRDMALRPSVWEKVSGGAFLGTRLMAAGFACIMLFALGSLVWINRSSKTDDQANLASAVRLSWQEMTAQAVGDHENCAVAFHLTEKPVSLDQAAVSYGPFNKDLDKTVATAVNAVLKGTSPDGTELLEAHYCLFEGRRFAHIVLKQKGRVVSVLVTDTDLPAGNDNIQTAHFDGLLNAAGFHLGHHAVFVVSELPETDNAALARMIAPAIRLHGEKVGA